MKYSLSLLLVLILFSCNPAKHLSRFIGRHPELVEKDTVWKVDTIWTKSVQKDTTFYYNSPDTVYMNEGKLHLKYYFRTDSTIYLQGKCDADTVIKYYPVQVNSVAVAKALTWKQKIKIWIFDNGWWVAIIIFLVWKIFGKALKTYFPFLNFL